MSDDFFPNASDAHRESVGRTTILAEIQAIQNAINTSLSNGSLTAMVGPGASPPTSTTMTTTPTYFNAYSNALQYQDDASNVCRGQMNDVIKYFTRLGYVVKRVQYNSTTQFTWQLTW